MKDKTEKALVCVFGAALAIAVIMLFAATIGNCDGTLVRGLIWLECIPN